MRAIPDGRGAMIVGCVALLTLFGAGTTAAQDGCDGSFDTALTTDETGESGAQLQFAVEVSTEAECARIVFDLVLEVQLPNGHANRVRLERQVELSDGGEAEIVRYSLPAGHQLLSHQTTQVSCVPCDMTP